MPVARFMFQLYTVELDISYYEMHVTEEESREPEKGNLARRETRNPETENVLRRTAITMT